jgi:tetratricopeptide (TPR) repeat protein
LEGEIYIINQQFYIIVNGTNFTNQLIAFKSDPQPFSALQTVIDKACENINFQIAKMSNQQQTLMVLVKDFVKYGRQNSNNSQDAFYDQDFPSRYLSINLKNSKDFLIIPYGNQGSSYQPSITISGKITYNAGTRGTCVIDPVIRFNDADSLVLQSVKGDIFNKDELLSKTLKNIQSVLNVVASKDGFDSIKKFIEGGNHSKSDYENAFLEADSAHNYALAYCFAEQLAIRYSNTNNKSELLKGKLYLQQNNLLDAINSLNTYLASNNNDHEATYYLGSAYLQNGRYKDAKAVFLHIDSTTNAFKDISYKLGLSTYYLGGFNEALNYFLKQLSSGNPSPNNIYLYISFCYENLGNWDSGLQSIRKLYQLDTLNKIHLSNYYADYAAFKLKKNIYQGAFDYYKMSFDLYPRYFTLVGQINTAIHLSNSDNIVKDLIQEGIKSKTIDSNIMYSTLAQVYVSSVDSLNLFIKSNLHKAITYKKLQAKVTKDTVSNDLYQFLGSAYFRLNLLDSSLYYYERALKTYQIPDNYLNLAELQVIMLDPDGALNTLTMLDKKYYLAKKDADLYSGDYPALFYFYQLECKILKSTSHNDDVKQLQDFIKQAYDPANNVIISNWSFKTYYNWVKNTKKIDEPKRKELMDSLCIILPFSEDKNLSCIN